jgi:hypothetical protein
MSLHILISLHSTIFHNNPLDSYQIAAYEQKRWTHEAKFV